MGNALFQPAHLFVGLLVFGGLYLISRALWRVGSKRSN